MYTGVPTDLPIKTAEQAINRGDAFLSRFYLTRRPITTRQEGNQWKVVFDVSIIGPKQRVFLTIDSESGAITEFSSEGIA